ncbi:MAG: hypothetical protein K8T25_09890 [Planctomycetia bacterium]|nr:hypothetical protein [Planctomycetia bacterium]
MIHPLHQLIEQVRRGARRIALAYGAGWTLFGFLAALGLFGLLDGYLRVDHRAVRLLLTLGVLLVVAAAVWRLLRPALKFWPSDVALAQRLADRFPELGDRMASAVEFLGEKENDPLAGSALLRRAVIVQATSAVRQHDPRQVLDRRPAQRGLGAAAVALCIAAAVYLVWPEPTEIALARLANPFSSTRWPKTNQLDFRAPPGQLAVGQNFEVEVIDRNGRLPASVQIQYQFTGPDGPRLVSEPMHRLGGTMVAHRDNVQGSFSYRAVGGDDDTMLWHNLAVIEPPRCESVRVTLLPPAYTGWPKETSTGPIAALAGTRMEFHGTVSKPLREAAFRFDGGSGGGSGGGGVGGKSDGANGGGTRVVAQLSADGRSFDLSTTADGKPLLVKESGNYWFELYDREGIAGGADERWPLRAVADDPPTVSIEKPTTDQYLTPEASLSLRVLAKDRLAIRQVALRYSRSDRSAEGDHEIPLYTGPEKMATTDRTGLAIADGEGERRQLDYAWKLADLKLPPGTQLTVQATATDYQPATGQSPALRVFIITPRELEERLTREQTAILGSLSRALKMQREARSKATQLDIQLKTVGRLDPRDVDQLQGLELAQRDVRRELSGANNGVRTQINSLLDKLRDNQVGSPAMARRMAELGALVDRLEGQELPNIDSELTAAAKSAQAELEQTQSEPGANDPAPANQKNSPAGATDTDGKQSPPSGKSDGTKSSMNKGAENKGAENKTTENSGIASQSPDNQAPQNTSPEKQTASPDEKPSIPPESKTPEQNIHHPPSSIPHPKSAAAAPLAQAARQQDQVIDALDGALTDLERWDRFRGFGRALGEMQRQQQELQKQGEAMLAKTVGRNLKDLSPQEQADLKKLSEKQAELARSFDKAQQGMQQARRQLDQTDPVVAQSLDDALQRAQESGVAEQLRSAGENVGQNQMSAAQRQQQNAARGLEEMTDILANRREQELSRLVQKFRQAEAKLAELRKQQSALRKKAKAADKIASPEERKRELQRLAREQQQLQQEAGRLARQLQRLDARAAADKMAGAGSKMSSAGQAGESGNTQKSDDDAAEAEKDLEEAQQQLAQERRQAELDLADEELVRLKDQLKALRDHQQTLLTETKRLEQLRVRQEQLTRGQQASVSDLSRQQAGLAGDTNQMARKLSVAEGFALALDRTTADMNRAADRLARLDTGREPQRAQQRAFDRMNVIQKALELDKPDKDKDMEEEGNGGQGAGQQPPPQQQSGDGIHTLSELKLLRLMQEDVRSRTDAVNEHKTAGGPLSDADLRELGELAEEQGRLADLIFKLKSAPVPAPEENPDKLPGGKGAETDEEDKDKGQEKDHAKEGDGVKGGNKDKDKDGANPVKLKLDDNP